MTTSTWLLIGGAWSLIAFAIGVLFGLMIADGERQAEAAIAAADERSKALHPAARIVPGIDRRCGCVVLVREGAPMRCPEHHPVTT